MFQAFSPTHYSSLSLIRMPTNTHIILMHHVMIKNNEYFHFSSHLSPYFLFLSSHRKATCLLLYGVFLTISSIWDWEDVWLGKTMMVIPFWHFCHWILSASYGTCHQICQWRWASNRQEKSNRDGMYTLEDALLDVCSLSFHDNNAG